MKKNTLSLTLGIFAFLLSFSLWSSSLAANGPTVNLSMNRYGQAEFLMIQQSMTSSSTELIRLGTMEQREFTFTSEKQFPKNTKFYVLALFNEGSWEYEVQNDEKELSLEKIMEQGRCIHKSS